MDMDIPSFTQSSEEGSWALGGEYPAFREAEVGNNIGEKGGAIEACGVGQH